MFFIGETRKNINAGACGVSAACAFFIGPSESGAIATGSRHLSSSWPRCRHRLTCTAATVFIQPGRRWRGHQVRPIRQLGTNDAVSSTVTRVRARVQPTTTFRDDVSGARARSRVTVTIGAMTRVRYARTVCRATVCSLRFRRTK